MPGMDPAAGNPAPQGANSGGSPASTSGPSTTSSPATKIDYGMAPQESKPSASGNPSTSSGTQYDDKWWGEHGEHVFKHERFQELSGYKQKYEQVAPLVEEYGNAEDILRLNSNFGPIYKKLNEMDPAAANALWGQLVPLFNAIVSGQEVTPFLAQKIQATVDAAAGDNLDDDDPVKAELNALKKNFDEFKGQTEAEKAASRKAELQKTGKQNLDKYESRFGDFCKEKGIPEEAIVYLGDIMVSRLPKYMPKNRNNQPLNPLFNYNEKAFDTCFEKEIMPAFKAMSKAGVSAAIATTTEGGPAIPNSHSSGAAPAGTGTPPNHKAKAARMAQFFQTGH